MGKKRSTTNTKAKKVVRQRTARALRDLPASDGMLPEWRRFLAAFPTVQAAAEAAAKGREVLLNSHEHADFRRRVLLAANGVIVEDTIYPHMHWQDLIATAWLNHPKPGDDTVEAVKAFLWSVLPEGSPADGLTVVQEQGVGPVPVFGYRMATAAEGLTDWDEVDERNDFGPLYLAMKYFSDDRIDPTPDQIDDFRRRGLPARACSQCGNLVTNGHPDWPGVWVVLGEEGGPVCPDADNDGHWDDVYTVTVHGPHRVTLFALQGGTA
ncbi:hypothetical protein ACFU7Y_27400 [Kitasatospora sp. NPDC057542]|uniref:hypothetical protein n=1 Tax=Kitasatospora sp. NPDC057542 TaxID=3346162 RepID=UPI00367BB207